MIPSWNCFPQGYVGKFSLWDHFKYVKLLGLMQKKADWTTNKKIDSRKFYTTFITEVHWCHLYFSIHKYIPVEHILWNHAKGRFYILPIDTPWTETMLHAFYLWLSTCSSLLSLQNPCVTWLLGSCWYVYLLQMSNYRRFLILHFYFIPAKLTRVLAI